MSSGSLQQAKSPFSREALAAVGTQEIERQFQERAQAQARLQLRQDQAQRDAVQREQCASVRWSALSSGRSTTIMGRRLGGKRTDLFTLTANGYNLSQTGGICMKLTGEHGGVLIAGIVTSIATAVVVTIFHSLTGFNVFGFSVFVVVPAGAICCGFAAASGHYYAAKYLHMHPSKNLLWQIVGVAALTQFAIYWLEYKTLIVEGINISERVEFIQYMDISLTSQHMKFGRAANIDAGQVGSFGYWLAVIDFIGFVAGGVFLYFNLKAEPTCADCQKYLGVLTKKADSFVDQHEFQHIMTKSL